MRMTEVGVYRLRDGIIRLAVEDYKKYYIRRNTAMVEYLEGFFRSECFSILTEDAVADVDAMICIIQQQAREAETERMRKKAERELKKEMMKSGANGVYKGDGGTSEGNRKEA